MQSHRSGILGIETSRTHNSWNLPGGREKRERERERKKEKTVPSLYVIGRFHCI